MYRAYREKMSAASKLKVLMFIGTTREGRLGLRVAKFMERKMKAEPYNYDVEVFDPEVMQFPMLTKPCHFYGPERTGCPQWLLDAEKKVWEADAYVLVSAEYNHCIPPALSNMLDHFPGSIYSWKPSGIVCYSAGIYGGMRAAMQLRAMTGEIGCISVSNIFGIPQVSKSLDEEGNPIKPHEDHMNKGAKAMLDQLTWMALAMKNQRDVYGTPGNPKPDSKKS